MDRKLNKIEFQWALMLLKMDAGHSFDPWDIEIAWGSYSDGKRAYAEVEVWFDDNKPEDV